MSLLGQNGPLFLLVRGRRPLQAARVGPNIQRISGVLGKREALRDSDPVPQVNVFIQLQWYAHAGLENNRVYRLEENMKIYRWDCRPRTVAREGVFQVVSFKFRYSTIS